MKHGPAFALATFCFALVSGGHAASLSPNDAVYLDLIVAEGYSGIAARIGDEGTLGGLPPDRLAALLLGVPPPLSDVEVESLLVMLMRVHGQADDQTPALLVERLVADIEDLNDWTLVGLILEHTVALDIDAGDAALLTAERIVRVLESPSADHVNYERAALAASAAALAAADGAPAAARRIALAETMRSLARLSRSERVVRRARGAARALLDF